jgi:gamma-glutamyltranspeptidase/glutathione hydrolase
MQVEGSLTADDLATHEGAWGEPISSTYRGYTIYETPPPTQGLAALLTLNLLGPSTSAATSSTRPSTCTC